VKRRASFLRCDRIPDRTLQQGLELFEDLLIWADGGGRKKDPS